MTTSGAGALRKGISQQGAPKQDWNVGRDTPGIVSQISRSANRNCRSLAGQTTALCRVRELDEKDQELPPIE
jgi:hypothetical protein